MRSQILGLAALAAATALLISSASASPFLAGDLAVYQAGPPGTGTNGVPGNAATAINIVELDKTTASQSSSNTIAIPNLFTSGSASSNGLLALSNDRTQLDFTGHTSAAASGNENAVTGRGVGVLDPSGNCTLAATYTGTGGNQTRGATTIDNSTYAVSDQGGIYTNNASSASPSANTRGIKSFGGTLYVLQQSSAATSIVVSTLSAASGGTITGLTGLANSNTATDFYLVASGNNGSTYDTLYVTSGTASGTGISKFSLNTADGSWASQGTAAITGGLYGVAAEVDPNGGFDIYGTTGSGGAVNGVSSFVDSAAYNAPISVGAATSLYTAPSGAVLKGIDFAPVPEPTSAALLSLAGISFVASRRTRRKA